MLVIPDAHLYDLKHKRSAPCVYCGRPASTVDHVIPKCRGGTDDPSNLVLACSACNGEKGCKSLEDFLLDRWHGT